MCTAIKTDSFIYACLHKDTYTENVVVNRSNILIRSANGSAVTIVQSNRTDMHMFNITDQNSSIMNISVVGNSSAIGIAVFNSSGNAILNGEITNCEQGIQIASGSNNRIKGNIIRNNTIVGVCIYSGGINTEIHENCFLDNEPEAWDNGTGNNWTSNYWSPTPGGVGNYDIPGKLESEDKDLLDESSLIEQPA